jgi:protein-tyrosine phosphatase
MQEHLGSSFGRIDANRIGPRFWIGSAPPHGRVLKDAGFDVLVLCAKEHQPRSHKFPGLTVVHAGIDDGFLDDDELEVAIHAAHHVTECLGRGERVLVTCWMGKNRSGLVSALALYEITNLSGSECVRAVQRARSGALYNEHFAEHLRSLR